jgi:hypothetical protein
MQNFAFFEVCNYFSYFYSLLPTYSIEKEFKMEKLIVGRFLHGQPSSASTPVHLYAQASLSACYHAAVADRWGPPVGAVLPQSPLLRARVSSSAKFLSSSRPPIECSHHLNVHLSTCHREPSHCVDAAHCSAATRCCSSWDAAPGAR